MYSRAAYTPNLIVTLVRRMLVIMLIAQGQIMFAEEPFIYPANGQTPELQEQDKYGCYQFGRTQSGFDPMQATSASAPGASPRSGLRGAVAGAAVGGIVDGGDGALKGAAAGATLGMMRRRGHQRQQQKAAQQQAEAAQVNRSNYNRAFSACMQGRGYTLG